MRIGVAGADARAALGLHLQCERLLHCSHRLPPSDIQGWHASACGPEPHRAAERVHVKLYANSAQQPGHALCQFSRLSISDARRLVALLGPNTYKWNDGKQLQLAPEALQAVLQWQTIAGEYLAHLG